MDLFPDIDLKAKLAKPRASARRHDPETSHEAARNAEPLAKTHRAILLTAVRKFPGLTSAELASKCGLDRYQAARRLPELRKAGLVVNGPKRRCAILGTKQIIWEAK